MKQFWPKFSEGNIRVEIFLTDFHNIDPRFQNSADGKTNFLKISAPNDLLERYARILNLQIPTKVLRIIQLVKIM
jgi:hypothetical protein